MSHFDEIDVGDLSNITLNCHSYYIVVNKVFLQFNKCEKVDVFEHHRFCDEFSHLVYTRFVRNASLF